MSYFFFSPNNSNKKSKNKTHYSDSLFPGITERFLMSKTNNAYDNQVSPLRQFVLHKADVRVYLFTMNLLKADWHKGVLIFTQLMWGKAARNG